MRPDDVTSRIASSAPTPKVEPGDRQAARLARLAPIVRDLPRNGLLGAGGTLLLAVYAAWRLDQAKQPWLPPLIWWSAYTLSGGWGVVLSLRYLRGPQSDDALLSAARKLLWVSLLAGLVWGTSAWVMLPAPTTDVAIFVFLGHIMVLTSVVNAQGNDRRIAFAYAAPATLAFVTGLFRQGEIFYYVLGCGFLVFTASLLTFAKAQEETIDELVHLRLETARLLLERTEQQRQSEILRREAEDARIEAERANKDKSTFLAAAGHDLRQPMHALVLYHDHMRRLNQQSSLVEAVEGSAKALASMRSLLDSILEVSRLLTGSVKPVDRYFPIAPMLDRLDAQMRPQAQAKGLAYRTTVRADKVVHSDEVLLERVLRNLIANAIRYTNCGAVHVDVCMRKQALLLRVVDTGIGISPEYRARVFQPFFQVSRETRGRRKGLGIGLTVVAELSKLLEVGIELRSQPGRGSIFSVRVPFADDAALARDTQMASSPYRPAGGAFAVVLDDEEESLQAMASALRLLGCKVLTAASSKQAIEGLSQQELMPEVIVSDYHLADELGPDAVAAILRAQRLRFGVGPGIASILVTGDPELADAEGSALKRGLPLLVKPVSLEALNTALGQRLAELADGYLDD